MRRPAFRSSISGIFTIAAISVIVLVAIVAVSIMSFFRVFNMADNEIDRALTREGDAVLTRFMSNTERTAVFGLSLAQQIKTHITNYLSVNAMEPSDLNDDPQAIADIQLDVYTLLHTSMHLAECSGAFMILNATANTKSAVPSRSALYLKFANIYSQRVLNDSVTLLRGASTIASKMNVPIHTIWDLEITPGYFTEVDSLVFPKIPMHALPRGAFFLTPPAIFTSTNETARLYVFPIEYRGQVIGICGFEVNATLFRLMNKTTDTDGLATRFALIDKVGDRYIGQMSDSSNSLRTTGSIDEFSIAIETPFPIVKVDGERYIAQLRPITVGSAQHTAAILMPEANYIDHKAKWQRQTIAFYMIGFAVVIVIVLTMRWFFANSIIRGIEAVKSGSYAVRGGIRELDELHSTMDALITRTMIDPLTLTGNRTKLLAAFEAMTSDREHAWALVLMDLDSFSEINDRFGHSVGDEYLRTFAEILRSAPGADAFRYGGDVFCVLFTGKNMEAVRAVCRTIAMKFSSMPLVDKYAKVGVSFGIAMWDGAEAPSHLLKRANDDLIASKSAAR